MKRFADRKRVWGLTQKKKIKYILCEEYQTQK